MNNQNGQNINLGKNQVNQGGTGFGQRPHSSNMGNQGYNPGVDMGQPQPIGQNMNNMGYNPGVDMGQPQPIGQNMNSMGQNMNNQGQNMNNMGGWQQNPNMNMGGPMNQPPRKPEFNVNLGNSPLAKVGQTGIKLVVYVVIAWLLMATQMTASIAILFLVAYLIEKDNDLSKAIMVALATSVGCLLLINGWNAAVSVVQYLLSGAVDNLSIYSKMYGAVVSLSDGVSAISSLINRVYDIVVLIVGFLNVKKIASGQEIHSKIIDKFM